jgi:hypothetical protein
MSRFRTPLPSTTCAMHHIGKPARGIRPLLTRADPASPPAIRRQLRLSRSPSISN